MCIGGESNFVRVVKRRHLILIISSQVYALQIYHQYLFRSTYILWRIIGPGRCYQMTCFSTCIVMNEWIISHSYLVSGPKSSWSRLKHFCIAVRASSSSTFKHLWGLTRYLMRATIKLFYYLGLSGTMDAISFCTPVFLPTFTKLQFPISEWTRKV